MARLQELSDLERRGWDSLCDGTGQEFYGDLLTEDGVMVLAHGMMMDRPQVVAALGEAPPWHGYRLQDERLVELPDGAALVYRAEAWRGTDEPPFVALMSSVYVRTGGGWRLALYQQTPVPAPD